VPGSGLPGEQVVGMPLRRSITGLDRQALRAQARQFFGLPPQGPVLLVFGGSLGARTLNTAVTAALPELLRAGVAVLHAHGKGGEPAPPARGYLGVPYIERMDLAYAAADAVLCRAGATTVAEVSAVGLPAVYVPLPHGNGEQALNARPVVTAGGGVLVDDADLTGERVFAELVPLLRDPRRLAEAGAAARSSGHADAADRLARMVLELVGSGTNGAPEPATQVLPPWRDR
jgi:UDP-N-acetylglucosamine--N-acetylmuramyl-(pentapeptide) pyrophosphoryl-undecaprenol N-acetylglucosamine transferase